MKGKDGTRYNLEMIKGAEIKDGTLVIRFFGRASMVSINEPNQKEIETFVPNKLVILVEKGLSEVLAVIEVQPGYARMSEQCGEQAADGTLNLNIDPADFFSLES